MSELLNDTLMKSYDHKKLTNVNSHKNHMSHKKSYEVDSLVNRLLEQYDCVEYKPLFRKAAWYLPEATIITFMEKAAQAQVPCNYFVRCAKNELRKLDESNN